MKRRSPIRWFLIGTSLGAAAMYVLDPVRGARRGHGIADRTLGAFDDVEDLAGKARRDVTNRMHGIAARARGAPAGQRARGALVRGTPERRILEGGVGALLALWGLVRRGLTGTGATMAGVGLIARAAAPRADGTIRVQKTITITAPIEEADGATCALGTNGVVRCWGRNRYARSAGSQRHRACGRADETRSRRRPPTAPRQAGWFR